jgi:hypothetical protein
MAKNKQPHTIPKPQPAPTEEQPATQEGPQRLRSGLPFCSHIAAPCKEPKDAGDLLDNANLLLTQITALFDALFEILPDETEDPGRPLASLGLDLCKELGRRMELLANAQRYLN